MKEIIMRYLGDGENFHGLTNVQELVRCKDCKYNSNPPEYGNAVCDTFYGMTDQMGFCHMGERRDNER